MRFEIKAQVPFPESKPLLHVVFYTKTDAKHLSEGYEKGIFTSVSQIPESKDALIAALESMINACIIASEQEK